MSTLKPLKWGTMYLTTTGTSVVSAPVFGGECEVFKYRGQTEWQYCFHDGDASGFYDTMGEALRAAEEKYEELMAEFLDEEKGAV